MIRHLANRRLPALILGAALLTLPVTVQAATVTAPAAGMAAPQDIAAGMAAKSAEFRAAGGEIYIPIAKG